METHVIENYYQLVTFISNVLIQLLIAVGIAYFFSNADQYKWKKWMPALDYMIIIHIIRIVWPDISSIMCCMIALLVVYAVLQLCDSHKWKDHGILFIVIFLLRWFTEYLMNEIILLISYANEFLLSSWVGIENQSNFLAYIISYCMVRFLAVILFAFLYLGALWGMKKLYVNKGKIEKKTQLCFFLIPFVAGMVCLFYNQVFEQLVGSRMYGGERGIQILLITNAIILSVEIVCMIVLYYRMREQQKEERDQYVLSKQVQDIQKHIKEAEQIYGEIRGMRHDLNNHICILKNLIEQGENEAASEYINKMQKSFEVADMPIKTGNPVTDIIANETLKKAKKKNVKFESYYSFPQEGKIDAFDMSILLNNALENALEAVKEGGEIKLISTRKKNAYLLTITNSFHGIMEVEEKSGLVKTTKKDTFIHGFGLQNMKTIAQKYCGDLRIEQQGELVTLSILLMLKLENLQ